MISRYVEVQVNNFVDASSRRCVGKKHYLSQQFAVHLRQSHTDQLTRRATIDVVLTHLLFSSEVMVNSGN